MGCLRVRLRDGLHLGGCCGADLREERVGQVLQRHPLDSSAHQVGVEAGLLVVVLVVAHLHDDLHSLHQGWVVRQLILHLLQVSLKDKFVLGLRQPRQLARQPAALLGHIVGGGGSLLWCHDA
eukprot:16434537-Heterocapsa_arctica.AAC.1